MFEGRKRVVFGTPINPMHLLEEIESGSFCVSYFNRQKLGRQLDQVIDRVGADEILLVDNGAFSAWRAGVEMDSDYWDGFLDWAADIAARSPQAVIVIPDVIDGNAADNDNLMHEFMSNGGKISSDRMMPVWHMHESLDRLQSLLNVFQYIAVGSSGEFAKVATPEWTARIEEAMAVVDAHEASGEYRPWIHMMRAQSQAAKFGFDSSDSTNVAMNHSRYKKTGAGHVGRFAKRVAAPIEASATQVDRTDTPQQQSDFVESWNNEWSAQQKLIWVELAHENKGV